MARRSLSVSFAVLLILVFPIGLAFAQAAGAVVVRALVLLVPAAVEVE
jgi:hypothetical protein